MGRGVLNAQQVSLRAEDAASCSFPEPGSVASQHENTSRGLCQSPKALPGRACLKEPLGSLRTLRPLTPTRACEFCGLSRI